MKRINAILGGIGLAIVLTLIACAFFVSVMSISFKSETWKPDTYAAIASAFAAIALVFVGVYTVFSAEKLAEKQKEFLEKMERQKTRPFCDFIMILDTSTKKPLGVYLMNSGHGPALEMKWTFFLKGVEIPEKGRNGFFVIAKQYSLGQWLEVYFPNRIAASSEIPLFIIRTDVSLTANAKRDLQLMIKDMDIKLDFLPIIGDAETLMLQD